MEFGSKDKLVDWVKIIDSKDTIPLVDWCRKQGDISMGEMSKKMLSDVRFKPLWAVYILYELRSLVSDEIASACVHKIKKRNITSKRGKIIPKKVIIIDSRLTLGDKSMLERKNG